MATARVARLEWRTLYTRWQPYGTLVFLCALYMFVPTTSFFLLALIHWTALDALRARKPLQVDAGVASQAASIEEKQRFCGAEVTITNSQIYRVGDRHYLVQVSRAEHDLDGRELA